MNILAIETATAMCSVALSIGGRTIARAEHAPRGHAGRLLPWSEALLAEAGIGFAELDGMAVGRGPGGFTSLRIGLGVAQGIALAHDLPVYPVSSLAALALSADPVGEQNRCLALIDARMGEVFAGWFERSNGVPVALMPESVLDPRSLSVPSGTEWLVAGSGLASYPSLVAETLAGIAVVGRPDTWPLARDLFALAAAVEPVAAWEVEPRYVRNQVTQ